MSDIEGQAKSELKNISTTVFSVLTQFHNKYKVYIKTFWQLRFIKGEGK